MGFQRMGQKFEKKFEFLTSPISQRPLKIEACKQRMKLFDPPCRNTEICPPWKSCLECEWRVCVSSTGALVNNLLYQFNGWDLKIQLFKFCASRHQQDRGILLETDARAMKIVPRGCLETRQCLEAPHHCFQGAEVHGTGRHSLYSSYKL